MGAYQASAIDAERSKRSAALTFLIAAVWILLVLSVTPTITALAPFGGELLHQTLNAVLLLAGLLWIARRRVFDMRALSAVGFAGRPSAGAEMGLGVVVGWAIAVALVLPAALTSRIHASVSMAREDVEATLSGLSLLVLNAVVTQIVFYGLAFRALVKSTSGTFAAVVVAAVNACLLLLSHAGDGMQALFSVAMSLLFSMLALRTRAIWTGLALQTAWGVGTTLLFGLSSFCWPPARGVVSGYLRGPRWLVGGLLGPEASLIAFVVLFGAFIVLWRSTRDWAWHYAFDPITGAGYPMEVEPPAEHARMEAAVASSTPLIQIQGISPAAEDKL